MGSGVGSVGGGAGEDEFVYESAITNETFSEVWTLDMQAADRIGVRVERVDGNLIPDVTLLGANEQEIARSFGADRTGAVAEIESVTLPAAGTYQIAVSREGGETGVTTGSYRLRVSLLGAAAGSAANLAAIGAVQYDTPLEGVIAPQHWLHRYTLDAAAADAIRVTAERTSGTLFPEVDVVDSNGASLRTGFTASSGDAAQIDRLDLPGAGQYTVIVRREQGQDGDTAGGYRLTVELIGAGEGSPLLAGSAGTVAYNTLLQGEIGGGVWRQDWQLVAEAGDTITIAVDRFFDEETGFVGNLMPEVILLGGSGQELRRSYVDRTGASAVIERYTLDGPGTYTVRVTRSGDQTGPTSGPYTLTVILEGSGEGSPYLTPLAGALQSGVAVTGEVSAARWADSWTYEGQADEAVDILVRRTGGTLIPRLDLQDANGNSIYSVYPEPGQDTALITGYRLPGTGQYRVVVFRLDGQTGSTSGTYELLLRPTPPQ